MRVYMNREIGMFGTDTSNESVYEQIEVTLTASFVT
jgi:hypothetical protein